MSPVEKDPAAGLNAALAATFRGERGALGMTIEELAEKSDVPMRSLMRFLNAQRHMDMAVVEAIAQGLGMTVTEAVGAAQARLDKAAADLPQLEDKRGSVVPSGPFAKGTRVDVVHDADVALTYDPSSLKDSDVAARKEDAEKPRLSDS